MTIDEVIASVQNPQFNVDAQRYKRSAGYKNARSYNKKHRIYIWVEDESLMDNLMNRHDRPHKMYREQILPEVFEQLGWPADTTVKWSQYAGCPCSCSPGFIVQKKIGSEYGHFYDVHVDISPKINT